MLQAIQEVGWGVIGQREDGHNEQDAGGPAHGEASQADNQHRWWWQDYSGDQNGSGHVKGL